MKLEDFNFELPTELIAQKPSEIRDHSRLLVAGASGEIENVQFYDIMDYLEPSDLIIFNNSKVIRAKLLLNKNNRKIELYLNKQISTDNHNIWQGFAKPSKKLQENDIFHFGEHKIIIRQKLSMGSIIIEFILKNLTIFDFLEQFGEVPLPPYIKRTLSPTENYAMLEREGQNSEFSSSDEDRYQTIYSDPPGSVAAPTAGLHFTNELLEKIKAKNIEIGFVTLHVGAGTFLPVKTENIDEHKMHKEYCNISQSVAAMINKAKKEGRRIIAIGSTSLRAIEASSRIGDLVESGAFENDIFIKPGYKFNIVDMLVTNFHLPKSTLFILICAFIGHARAHEIYKYATAKRMKFFSYGDACLFTKKI